MRQKNITKAVGHYRQAVDLEPSSELFRFSLGRVLQALGRGAEAEKQYRQAIQRNPEGGALARFQLANLS